MVASTNKVVCKAYIVSKQTLMIGHKPMTPILRLLQKAHLNLWRPYDLASMRDNCYFIIIINNNTRKIWTYGIMSKDMFFLVFKIWKKGVEIEIKLKLSSLQIDGKSEYVSLILKKFYKKKEVVIKFTLSYIPKQNFITKWFWHIFNTIKNTMLVNSKLPRKFWAEAIVTAVYLKNLLSTSLKKGY